MRVEVTIDKKKKLPEGVADALTTELNKRLQRKFPDAVATVRLGGMDGLSVGRATPADHVLHPGLMLQYQKLEQRKTHTTYQYYNYLDLQIAHCPNHEN
ncbi:DinI-like family protein [Yersinia enterocolitica]